MQAVERLAAGTGIAKQVRDQRRRRHVAPDRVGRPGRVGDQEMRTGLGAGDQAPMADAMARQLDASNAPSPSRSAPSSNGARSAPSERTGASSKKRARAARSAGSKPRGVPAIRAPSRPRLQRWSRPDREQWIAALGKRCTPATWSAWKCERMMWRTSSGAMPRACNCATISCSGGITVGVSHRYKASGSPRVASRNWRS